MSEAKHTPTPWETSSVQYNDGTDAWDVCMEGGGDMIADLGQGVNGQADAEFIVRACNSHEALCAALDTVITAAEIIDGQDSPPDSDDVDYLHASIRDARAALKLARGES